MKALFILRASIIAALPFLFAINGCSTNSLSSEERTLICSGDGLMRVTTIADPADSLILRSHCSDLDDHDLRSDVWKKLASRMIATVTDPSQDGVGIAGPQVGLLRRVVAVQRFDKEGEPFELYPNIRIEPVGTETQIGDEGCLSVPGERAAVERFSTIKLRYTNPETLETVEEIVDGFTAVIFQHECDHLDGILFIDKRID